ncbi:MAG: SH3 domain-containing protein [Caldilineaceae bacterium]
MVQSSARTTRWLTILAIVVLSFSLMAVLSACGGQPTEEQATPSPSEAPAASMTEAPTEAATEAPTEAPTEPATEEPTAQPESTTAPETDAGDGAEESVPQGPLASMEHTPDPMLVGFTWEWISRDPNGNDIEAITVDQPEDYTLLFDADGLYLAKVDCNNAAGAYATSNIELDKRRIFMAPGPVTLAFCGEDSLDQAMMQMFGPAQTYSFEDDGETLIFAWAAAGPVDTFRKAVPAAVSGTEEPADASATEQPAEGAESDEATGTELDTTLANMTYASEFTADGTAPLVDGTYEEAAAPGSATKTTVTLLPEYTATGELNGEPASAVVLATDPGGSGTFIDLAVVMDENGGPVNVATTSLGDRTQVISVTIENNQIVVDMITHGPDDPMCCPTLEVVQSYELQDGQLVLVNTEEIGTVEESPEASAGASDPDPVASDDEALEVELPSPEADEPTGVVTAPAGVNVRTGPGTDYPILGVAPFEAQGEIVGRSEDGQWWVAIVPSAPNEQGWVAAAYVNASNVDNIPVIAAPPVPEGDANDAALSEGNGYEVPSGVLLYSASRVLQEGNRSYDLYDIYVVMAAPGSATELVANNAMQPALSPDRKTLAFKSMQSDKLGLGGYALDTGARLRFSRFIEDSMPRWSPSGDRIVYASNKEGDRAWRIYMTDAVAKESPADMTYTELGFGLDPDWHPSAELIVFKGCNEQGQECGLYTMGTDGSGRTQLTSVASDSRPRWLPDGSGVVFMSDGRDGNWELYRASADGSDVVRLTDNAAPDGLPAVSPDGSQIAFFSQRDDSWGVWTMPAGGGDAVQVTAVTGEQPDWLLQGIDWPR